MPEPGTHIEVLHGRNPKDYSRQQIDYAAALASELGRGRLVIVEPPATDDDGRDAPDEH